MSEKVSGYWRRFRVLITIVAVLLVGMGIAWSIIPPWSDRTKSWLTMNTSERMQWAFDTKARTDAAIQHVTSNDAIAREFRRLFPDARHWIAHYATDEPEWTSEVLLYGRYVFNVSFSIRFTDKARMVAERCAPARFRFVDVGDAEPQKNGTILITCGPLDGLELSQSQWDLLREANGEFEAAGVQLQKESPLPDFVRCYESCSFYGL
ncbi:MAG: hypothetical protein IID36_08205 [Planctomycetes bacterium]|nr:hypothetical protein [Planctomycetota bacterium]